MADLTGLSSVFDFGTKLIDKIWPDKTAQEAERNKAQLALLQLQQNGDFTELTERMKAIVAEAQSQDPWTSRARPSFLYVMYVMILMGIPMGILSVFNPTAAVQIASGMKAWLSAIPTEFVQLFGIGYVGYSAARTVDKLKGK